MESLFVKFAQYPSIETERLLLRPVTLNDAEAMFEHASDRENTRYTFPTNQSLEETKNNIAQFYLASPLGRWGNRTKHLVSLSELLTCTRLILFSKKQLLDTLSIKVLESRIDGRSQSCRD